VLKCPQCDSCALLFSHRRLWERPLRLFVIRAFRCRACNTRALIYYGPDFAGLAVQRFRSAARAAHAILRTVFPLA
jgi:hypothetical protein